MRHWIDRAVPDLCRWRIGTREVVAPPVRGRPDRPGREAAPAIGADVLQHLIDACSAEGALETADHRIGRLRRQRPVAVLAGRSQFKGHCCLRHPPFGQPYKENSQNEAWHKLCTDSSVRAPWVYLKFTLLDNRASAVVTACTCLCDGPATRPYSPHEMGERTHLALGQWSAHHRIGMGPLMKRKLTTILAADVVGYSSLMEADEAGTFELLRACRKQLFEPEISTLVEPILDMPSTYVWNSPHYTLGRAYFVKEDYTRAAGYLKDAPADAATSLPFLAASFAKLGKKDDATPLIAKARMDLPSLSVTLMRQLYPNRDPVVVSRQDEAMRLAGLPEG